ncbi:MAG: terminase small subunit [Planctomycetota bacterium]
MKKLTPKQEAFCREYLIDLNRTQAAIRAGYSARTARSQGQRLLTKVDIQKFVEQLKGERSDRTNREADDVLRMLWEVAEDLDNKTSDRLKSLELLGKHHVMFTDKTESTVTGGVQIYLPEKDPEPGSEVQDAANTSN